MIRTIAFLSLVVFPALLWGSCAYGPKHEFLMEVHVCQRATFFASISLDEDGDISDKVGASVNVIVLTGTVRDNQYDWGGRLEPRMNALGRN